VTEEAASVASMVATPLVYAVTILVHSVSAHLLLGFVQSIREAIAFVPVEIWPIVSHGQITFTDLS
jgi:hypothetical protein